MINLKRNKRIKIKIDLTIDSPLVECACLNGEHVYTDHFIMKGNINFISYEWSSLRLAQIPYFPGHVGHTAICCTAKIPLGV